VIFDYHNKFIKSCQIIVILGTNPIPYYRQFDKTMIK